MSFSVSSAGSVLQGDPACVGEDVVGAGGVGGVLRNADALALGHCVERVVALGVEAGGDGRDLGEVVEVRALLAVEHLHVGGVLVDIEVDGAFLHGGGGLLQVGEVRVLDGPAVLTEDRVDAVLKEDGVGAGGDADADRLVVTCGVGAAGGESQGEGDGAEQGGWAGELHDVVLGLSDMTISAITVDGTVQKEKTDRYEARVFPAGLMNETHPSARAGTLLTSCDLDFSSVGL